MNDEQYGQLKLKCLTLKIPCKQIRNDVKINVKTSINRSAKTKASSAGIGVCTSNPCQHFFFIRQFANFSLLMIGQY